MEDYSILNILETSIIDIQILSDMQEMQSKQQLTDFIITCGNDEIHLHQIILCCLCPYFKKMLLSGMQESMTKKVDMSSFNYSILSLIVKEYAYGKSIYITWDNVEGLLELSNFFELEKVLEGCLKFLLSRLNLNTCLKIIEITRRIDSRNPCFLLKHTAIRYTANHFKEIYNKGLDLSYELLEILLTSEYLIVESEDDLLSFCLSWIIKDRRNRQQYLQNIFNKIDFNLITKDRFAKAALGKFRCILGEKDFQLVLHFYSKASDKLISLSRPIQYSLQLILFDQVLIRNKNYFYYSIVQGEKYNGIFLNKEYETLQITSNNDLVFVLIENSKIMFTEYKKEKEKEQEQEWKLVSSLVELSDNSWPGIVVVKDELYLVGLGEKNNEFFCYNTKKEKWKKLQSLRYSCRNSSLVYLNGFLYCIGGQIKYETKEEIEEIEERIEEREERIEDIWLSTSNVERYNIKENSWITLSPMLNARNSMGTSVLENRIYVIGGFKKTLKSENWILSVECLNTNSNVWKSCKDLNFILSWPLLVSTFQDIYVLQGDIDLEGDENKVQKYNIKKDEWKDIPYMKSLKELQVLRW